MKENLIKVLRWIAVLPASAIAAFVANAFVVFGNKMSSFIWGGTSIISELFIFVVGAGVTGYGFISAGHYVAPKYKKQTALVLCAVLSLVCGASLTLGFIMHGFCWDSCKTAIAGVITIVSAISTYVNIEEEGR